MKAYFDPQYVWGAPNEEIELRDTEIIEKLKCPKGHSLKAEFWHMPDGGSLIELGVCYTCGYAISI